MITGYYNTHGFLRAADGTITTLDPSGSTGTVPTAINAKGDVAGYYTYQGHEHGFLRTADGTITSFDVDGAQYTQALGINSKDAIVGSGSGTIGFLRTPGGKISTFGQGLPLTQASGINDKGQIAGFYSLSQPPPYGHGYVGSPKSGFTNFDVPNGTQAEAFGINDSGVIAGSYYDSNYNQDGFVRTP